MLGAGRTPSHGNGRIQTTSHLGAPMGSALPKRHREIVAFTLRELHDSLDQIQALADQLQNSGYVVLRERVSRAGHVSYRLRALWAARGDPPVNPPDSAERS